MSKVATKAPVAATTDLTDRLDAVADRMDALRRAAQDAQAREGVARFQLTQALHEVLIARARDFQLSREALFQAYLRQAPRRRQPSAPGLRTLVSRIVSRIDRMFGNGAPPVAVADPLAGIVNADWYRTTYSDIAAGGIDPVAHFIANGCAEGRSPTPLFDIAWYAAEHSVELAGSGLSPVAHYMTLGAASGYAPHPLFDPPHYVGQGASPASGEDALAHYLREGVAVDLDPHPLFDARWYRAQQPVVAAGETLLAHYLREGWRHGLRPHRLFDPSWYAERHALASDVEPLTHFVTVGAAAGLDPSAWFDTAYYLAQVGDLADGRNPLIDYLEGGAWKLPQTAAGFATSAYLASHPDLAGRGLTPLERWASTGA